MVVKPTGTIIQLGLPIQRVKAQKAQIQAAVTQRCPKLDLRRD